MIEVSRGDLGVEIERPRRLAEGDLRLLLVDVSTSRTDRVSKVSPALGASSGFSFALPLDGLNR